MQVCKVCDSALKEPYTTSIDFKGNDKKKSYRYFKCVKCKAVINLDFNLKEIDSYYPHNYNDYISIEEKFNGFRLKILNLFSSSSSIPLINKIDFNDKDGYCIDFGAGDGRFAKIMSNKFALKWYAFDFQIRNNPDVILYDRGALREFVMMKKNFPLCITLNNVIEHIADFDVIDEIATCCGPNTILRIVTPNSQSLTFRLFKKYWQDLDSPRHFVIFSSKSLQMLLKKYDFNLVSLRQIYERRVVSNSLILSNISNKHFSELNKNQKLSISFLSSIFTLFQKFIFLKGDRVEYLFKKN